MVFGDVDRKVEKNNKRDQTCDKKHRINNSSTLARQEETNVCTSQRPRKPGTAERSESRRDSSTVYHLGETRLAIAMATANRINKVNPADVLGLFFIQCFQLLGDLVTLHL